jgi:hypothetical protein
MSLCDSHRQSADGAKRLLLRTTLLRNVVRNMPCVVIVASQHHDAERRWCWAPLRGAQQSTTFGRDVASRQSSAFGRDVGRCEAPPVAKRHASLRSSTRSVVMLSAPSGRSTVIGLRPGRSFATIIGPKGRDVALRQSSALRAVMLSAPSGRSTVIVQRPISHGPLGPVIIKKFNFFWLLYNLRITKHIFLTEEI